MSSEYSISAHARALIRALPDGELAVLAQQYRTQLASIPLKPGARPSPQRVRISAHLAVVTFESARREVSRGQA